MSIGYYPQQAPQQQNSMASILTLLPYLQDKVIKTNVDQLGALFNDFKVQWNAVNPGNLITAPDYVKS